MFLAVLFTEASAKAVPRTEPVGRGGRHCNIHVHRRGVLTTPVPLLGLESKCATQWHVRERARGSSSQATRQGLLTGSWGPKRVSALLSFAP